MNTGNKKEFYTIGEVSKITSIRQTVLRFWEEEFSQLNPKKTKFGHRAYIEKDIELILQIKKLLYEDGLTIKGAKAFLSKNNIKSENSSFNNRDEKIKIIKQKLNDLLLLVHNYKNKSGESSVMNENKNDCIVKGRNKEEQNIINKVTLSNPKIFYFWEELSEIEKDELISDIKSIDFDLVNDYYEKYYKTHKSEEIIIDSTEYYSIENIKTNIDIKNIGISSLKKGEVAFLTVAGGQASRLDYDFPKGCYPITPINGNSLFQVFAEKILFYSNLYSVELNWFIMTSDSNYRDTVNFFEKNNFFGLKKESVVFFKQAMLPTITIDNKLILENKNKIFKNPDGHGGILTALLKTGLLHKINEKKIKYISYFQVDNPLIKMADASFIGYHIKNNIDVSTKVIPKLYPEEKIGVIGKKNGIPGVIEYSDLPKEMMYEKNEDGKLKYLMGSIGIHIFSVDFLIHCTEKLPVHIALKKVRGYSINSGESEKIEEIDAIKFETFVFDTISLAKKSGFFETQREQEFYPLKNKTGVDSIDTCIKGQVDMFIDWLVSSKIINDEDSNIIEKLEISPLFAPDKETFIEKCLIYSDYVRNCIFDKDRAIKKNIYIAQLDN